MWTAGLPVVQLNAGYQHHADDRPLGCLDDVNAELQQVCAVQVCDCSWHVEVTPAWGPTGACGRCQ